MAEARRKYDQGIDEAEVFVGKDVLELLSSSMYVNPLSIFREYIQNAADAIDDATAVGLLPSTDEGCIEINLDHIDRRVVIRDNGSGLPNNEFPERMLSFGASEKRGTDARGFRGVGRLSGLGYVQQLVFRSRAKGDTKVFEATWDGRVIKRMLAATDSSADLRKIVREAITFNKLDPDKYPEHFFEVELVKPRRIGNDRLLNEIEIEAFLSQVCPCPFSPKFSFGEEITKLLTPYGRAGKSYRIHINDAKEPVYRPYRNCVEYSETKQSTLRDLETFEIKNDDGEPAAIGWLIHHDYQGSIPSSQCVRGLRARVGNIQIGHDRLFLDVFPEERFCSWSIGEVHVLDGRVVPNGRRDEFESNAHIDNIVTHLRPVGARIARECRVSSQKRNRIKGFELAADKIYEKLDVLMQGAVSASYAKSLKSEVGVLLSEMQKTINSDVLDDSEKATLKRQLKRVKRDLDAVTTEVNGDIFESLPVKKRPIYKEVFGLIYECSANQIAAKSLTDRMIDRLSRK